MRKIKFRGQSKFTTRKWLYGSYLVLGDKHYILPIDDKMLCNHEVIPETVGEFTGLTDKNGVEIYENDIIKVDIFTKPYSVSFGKSEKWGACFCVQSFNSITFLTKNWADTCEVIGHIHDNPELLQ